MTIRINLAAVIFYGVVIAIVAFFAWLIFAPANVAEREAEHKARENQALEDRKPRKVSEANGCEVWAFNPGGRWQYFTRCGAATQTTNTWEECRSVTSGKTTRQECTPHRLTITQEPKS
ncbi:hypothetical protein [Comamonas testosteroni]|uniref:hypothetical protein n=1 Tax=Comamonas testosteroni TaxID=285 RepID=UPI0026ED6E22|nr:hypothetical protein [Comamonas testosteroni]